MSKLPQVLIIDPPTDITFKGPFTEVVTSHIKLTNPSDRQVCFKVKTTAPKQYCVRPNSGLIPPSESVTVSVMLQPFDYNAEEKNKHKFMVQSAYVPENEHSLDNIWKNTTPSEMMDSKLRVMFDVPEQAIVGDKHAVSKMQPLSQAGDSLKPYQSPSLEADYRRAIDEAKRYLHQLTQLEQENNQLRERMQKLESTGMGGDDALNTTAMTSTSTASQRHLVTSGQRFTLSQLLLLFVVAVFIGLLLGKVF